ncbi:MAG: 3-phosphoshikimate 1-carboxyvinyltransferase [Brevinematia bacterium]
MLKVENGNVRIFPIRRYVEKSLTVPGSKSITNRVLVVSAMNSRKIKIKNVLVSDDTNHMLNALESLGFTINKYHYSRENDFPEIAEFVKFIESRAKDGLVVEIGGECIPSGYMEREIFTGNSGTTMRFLCSFIPLFNGVFTLDGDQRMRERPISDLTNALKQIGVDIKDSNGFPPVTINAKGEVKGGSVRISGKISSQFVSSMILSAPMYSQGLEMEVVDCLVSKPFVDMSLKILELFGVSAENDNYKKIVIPKGKYSRKEDFFVEPDLTNAFYFLSIPCIIPAKISIYGIGKNTVQGDIEFLKILEEVGCKIYTEDNHITVEGDGNPKGIEVDMNNIPDLVQTLSVIALFADRPTSIRNVHNLRVKETDRIKAICSEIKKLGGKVEEYEDGLKIIPQKNYTPGVISTYNDHRMAMSFSLLGLRIDGIVISDYRCTSKTFPSYWSYFEFLYQDHLY